MSKAARQQCKCENDYTAHRKRNENEGAYIPGRPVDRQRTMHAASLAENQSHGNKGQKAGALWLPEIR
jgi:hypothetical protein